ncbi:glutamate [NMDA] receptor subunit 1-like [Penaeus japonicus]|uniref:glutamate [NMDA] receptor subunit 1-like n=1 Tax=Penaeus japonicus TaxID=27405 RepID=UPI001C7166CE|nr:glutamate [NMDA] receptor subunit 1-like [Penaeus japonicus]
MALLLTVSLDRESTEKWPTVPRSASAITFTACPQDAVKDSSQKLNTRSDPAPEATMCCTLPKGDLWAFGRQEGLTSPVWMPHTVIIGSGSSFKVAGSMVEVMNIVAKKLGVCVEYVVPDDRVFGIKLANGSWSGTMGLVVREEVDMTGTVLSQEAERFDAVEFSVPLYMDAQRLIYKSPVLTSDIAGFIKPYTGLRDFLCTIRPHQNYETAPRLTGTGAKLTLFLKRNVEPAGIYDTLWHSCQWTLGATLAQSMVQAPTGTTVRILWGMWLLVALIVGSVYRSNLKAMLILPKLRLPFDNLQELMDTDIPCVVPDGSALMQTIMSAPPGTQLHKLRKQLIITKNVDKAIQDIIRGENAAFTSEHIINFIIHMTFSRMNSCPLYLASETYFGATSLSLAFPKGSPLKKKIDPILVKRYQPAGHGTYIHFFWPQVGH